jgi:MFS family permease
MTPSSVRAFIGTGLFAVLVILSASALSLGLLVPVLPLFFHDEGITAVQFGLLFAAYSGAVGMFEGFWGWLSDSIGLAPIIIGRMFILPLILFLFTRTEGLLLLSALLMLRAVFEAAVWPLGRAYVGQALPTNQRGQGMAVVQFVILASMSIGSLIGGVVKDLWDYDMVFYCALGLLLVGGLVALLRQRTLIVIKSTAKTEPEMLVIESPAKVTSRRRPIATIAAVMGFLHAGFGILTGFVPLYGALILNLNTTQIGLIFMVSGLVGLVALLPAGRISDRTGRKVFIVGGIALYGVALLGVAFAIDYWTLLISVAISAIGRSMMLPTILALSSEVMPIGLQGRAMGLLGVGEAIGISSGPAVAGWIWSAHGGQATFLFAGLLVGVGTVFALSSIKERLWTGNYTQQVSV